ncbi:hypothetical protein NBO_281g0003 [Nosema bombycis CQ1]|uniref:Uncharacterized protein n=1 Tax=Nosema bombycis (strain CQ1 / CVCC 102059) TaxID=578461 RepID=R0KS01_NOSB1|nr:hypothetical protein NBO_281g0003 [Nosema bombycis CQ1]|eukprot:EOB12982.1 hypothetical protein NBO_281g0003 [Nosema bombycis CQ1]
MKEEVIDDFINGLDSNTQKELLDCLMLYNNTIEDIFTDTSVHICLYTSYIDSIKANLVYNESIMLRNRSCYFYCLFLGVYMIIGFYLGFNIGNKYL